MTVIRRELGCKKELASQAADIHNLIAIISPSENPFEAIVKYISDKNFPGLSKPTMMALEALLFVHFIICIFCLAIVFLSLRGERDGRWFYKKLYISDGNHKASTQPLYLVNCGMTLAISQLFASIMTSIYICMIHRSNEDAVFRVKAPLTACLGLIYYFEFISFWIFSWSSLYTWLYSEASYATKLKAGCKRTISPLYFNLVFISIPTIVLFINCFCICFISKATRLFAQVWFGLVEELHSGSHIWKNLRENSRSQQAQTRLTDNLIASIKRSLDFYPELLKRLNSSIVIMKFICAYWTTAMVIIFVVMTFSLWNLLVVSYRSINKEQPESQNVPIVLESNSLSDGCSSKKISGVVSTENSHSLVIKRRLVHLSIRSGAMLLAILGTITISFIGAIHTKLVVTNQSWRSAISVIPLFIATVAALPITFQCWRVYSENKLLTHGKNQSEDSAIINRECMESVSEINVLRISMPPNLYIVAHKV